jgi:hypothetical protein
MICDNCKSNQASTEAIYEDLDGNLLILSLCDDLACQSKFVRISNTFNLTMAHSE